MNFSVAVITYILCFLFCLVLPLFLLRFKRKKGYKISPGHFLLGLFSFVIASVVYFLVLRFHLSLQDDIGAYYNTAAYRITIISLITAFFFTVLWILGVCVYSKRQMTRACNSFFTGFGSLGCILFGVYTLLMFLGLMFQYCTSTLLSFDETLQAFHFSPDVYISVFTPMLGHLSFAVAFVDFLVIAVCISHVLCTMAKKKIPVRVLVAAFTVLLICLIVIVDVVLFMSLLHIAHYTMAIICTTCALGAYLITRLALTSEKQEKTGYQKQFD